MFEEYMLQALSVNEDKVENNSSKNKLNESTSFASPNIYNIDTFTRKFFNGLFIQHSTDDLNVDNVPTSNENQYYAANEPMDLDFS